MSNLPPPPKLNTLHVKQEEPKITLSPEQIEKEFERFDRFNLSKPHHTKELFDCVPKWLYEQTNRVDLIYFSHLVRYSEEHKTLVMRWEYNNPTDVWAKTVSFKFRRLNGIKWFNKKHTSPNNTALARIHEDKDNVFVVEGAHDALTATLLGLSFIAFPTAGYRNFEQFKSFLRDGDNLIYICEDKTCEATMKIFKDMFGGELLYFTDIRDGAKMDLSDFVATKKSILEVIQ